MADDDKQIHDLRGELGGIRSELRGIRTEMGEGFDRVSSRVRDLESWRIAETARAEERRHLIAEGLMASPQPPRPPIHRDPRTYSVGGVGAALAVILVEFLKAFGAAPK